MDKKINTSQIDLFPKIFFKICFLYLFYNIKYWKQYAISLHFGYIWMFNGQNEIDDSIFYLIMAFHFLIFISIIYY